MRKEWQHEILIQPAFHDLDPMAIVWHGNYLKYFEIARSALLQKFDYDFEQMAASGYSWPIVDLRIKYIRPIRYDQKLKVQASISEWECRLRVDYLIVDASTDDILTKAHTIQVAVRIDNGEMQFATPEVFRLRIGAVE